MSDDVFDNSQLNFTSCDIESMRETLCNVYPVLRAKCAVHSTGELQIGIKDWLKLDNILFDTGSITANYISQQVVDKHRAKLQDRIRNKSHYVTLADKGHTVTTSEEVFLTLKFAEETGSKRTYKYSGTFIVLDMDGNEAIMGLPCIINELYDYFIFMLRTAREDLMRESKFYVNNLKEEALLEPWSFPPEVIAPEEDFAPIPSSFPDFLNYLSGTYEEAIQEYYQLLDTHVSEDMKDDTNVMELLKDKGHLVFVPKTWEGIKGIPPLELRWKDNLPDRMKPATRPVNTTLWGPAEKEVERFKSYLWTESRSPIASPIVIAAKATKPFFRICGDYVEINKYIENGHYPIPNVQHELQKITNFPMYIDVDMTNSFHQIKLGEITSERLSVQTPWGQYRPLFLPEGASPGSLILQEVVRKIFGDLDEWMIIIFDNLLILAKDPGDAVKKFEIFLDRCIEWNLCMKMSKTWVGFKEVNFFGYKCTHKKYELTEERKSTLKEIPFPSGKNKLKQIRRALGVGVFFKPFILNYSSLTAKLTDMTKKDFDWNESTWKHDYRRIFEEFKEALQHCSALYYPNYDADWILRTDASEHGVGAVLLQEMIMDGEKVLQPIAFISHKFSAQATRWSTIEQEAFGIFYAVQKLAYYLMGKDFVIETDHNNLLWMEQSKVAKIIRWRLYLQTFRFKIKHIAGKKNLVADWLSRLYEEDMQLEELGCLYCLTQDDVEDIADNLRLRLLAISLRPRDNKPKPWEQGTTKLPSTMKKPATLIQKAKRMYTKLTEGNTPIIDSATEDNKAPQELPDDSVEYNIQPIEVTQLEAFKKVHNAKVGHVGVRLTWTRLNQQFPNHSLSTKQIANLISECPTCLKTRSTLMHGIKPVIRSLKPPHQRSAVGIDAVEITPNGIEGQTHILVIVNLFTKHVFLYPSKGCTAVNLANAVWTYWANFGHTDCIVSDKGPDLTSNMMKLLREWMHVRHQFSITDKHANGVERIIKEVQRHLRAIVYDMRIQDIFSDPMMIPAVQYILNDEVSSETGYRPFELTFGSADSLYTEIPNGDVGENAADFLKRLNANLRIVRQVSSEYQQKLIKARTDITPPDRQNKYQKGDLVLFDKGVKPYPKLSPRYAGPYEVLEHNKNDVLVRHVIMGNTVTFSVEDLIVFTADMKAAKEAALRDFNQYEVNRIIRHTGDPLKRTSMKFLIQYADGDQRWSWYTKDIFDSIPYADYVSQFPYLHHLKYSTSEATKFIHDMNKEDITQVHPGDKVFVDIAWYGNEWAMNLNLKDVHPKVYVFEFEYLYYYHDLTRGKKPKPDVSRKLITAYCPIMDKTYKMTTHQVYGYGSNRIFNDTTMVLITTDHVAQCPQLLD